MKKINYKNCKKSIKWITITKNIYYNNYDYNIDRPKGLVNFGLNCYMNSLLQCLFLYSKIKGKVYNKKNGCFKNL